MIRIKNRFHKPRSGSESLEHDQGGEARANSQHITFLEMLRRCDSTIFKVCLMFTDRDPGKVKDMYQDIVCSLWESWPNFRGQSKENTWVYSIAINTAVSQVRHRSRSPLFARLDDETYNNLAEESQNSLVKRLYELIDHLSPNDKTILMLYLDCLLAREIGQILGISEAAVNHRIGRIKNKLKTLHHSLEQEESNLDSYPESRNGAMK